MWLSPKNVVVRLFSVVVVVPLVTLAALAASGDQQQGDHPTFGDVVCGPRCVQFLLDWYGKGDEDLVDLAREMQWPDVEAGASLGAISDVLSKRGIHTYAMQISPPVRLRWPYPVLLHLDAANSSDAGPGLGHFVVWLPSSSLTRYDIWNGLAGTRRYPSRDMTERLSGSILLTSQAAIADPSEAIRHVRVLWAYCIGLVIAAGGTIVLVRRSNVVRFLFGSLCHLKKEKRG